MKYRLVRRIAYPSHIYYTAERSRFGIHWSSIFLIRAGHDRFTAKEYKNEQDALNDIVDDKYYILAKKKQILWVMKTSKQRIK